MKKFKRIISLILTLAFVAGFNIPARAASGSMEGWGVSKYNGVEADYMLDNEVFHSGGTSLKMTRKSPVTSNVYMILSQGVTVEMGKTYQFSFWAKAKNINNVTTLIDWGKRAPLSPVMSTYDWTYFTFKYDADHSGSASFKIIVDGPTSAFWVDDLEFYEFDGKKVGKNLFKNPGFEGVNVAATPEASAGKVDEFAAEEFYATLSTSDIIPVYKTDSIVIDGDVSDWAGTTTISGMPNDPKRHVQAYATDVTDAVVDMSFAYDENYFYFLTVAKDDSFFDVEGSQYWSGDSIQMCLSEAGLNYGAEIGYAFSENGGGKYSLDFGPGEMEGILLNTTRNGDYTYFESAIPWELYYKEFRDEIVFCAIYNDNDGGGRKYAIQMTPGIAEGKLAAAFPTLRMVPEENNFFAWCEGNQSATVYENNTYDIRILNNSDEDKEYTVTIGEDVKTVAVPAQTGKRTEFDVVFDKAGDNILEVVVSDGESEQKFGYKVSVIATPDYYDGALVELQAKADEIKDLISECKAKGIPTDYEEPVAFILERWDEYIIADAKQNYYDIMEYTFTELNRMYEETKVTLEAYLAGEKTALATPKYVTSDIEIDGQTHWANTVWSDGTEERRPVFFIGYGHFTDARNDIPNFYSLGNNAIQQQGGVYDVISDRNGVPGYNLGGVGTQAKFEVVKNKAEAPSGSSYLKMTNTTPLAANKYKQLKQSVKVKPNTTYEYGGKVKATNAKKLWMSCVEWPKTEDGRKQLGGDYAWKNVQWEYTTGPEETALMMHILVEDVIDEFLVDDLFIREKGTKTNLLTNPGFEEKFEDFGNNKRASDLKIQWIFDMLKDAEENNIAVSLLLSPHYWHTHFIEDEAAKNLVGAAQYATMKSEETKEILTKYLDYILPEAVKYKSLANICITNEPTLDTQQNEAYYHDDFVAYLREVYNDDIVEYNRINGTNHENFDVIKMPTGLLPSVLLYDWKMYNDTVIKEWNAWMREEIEKRAPGIPVHHKIMSNTFEDDSALKIHIRYGSDFEDYADVSDVNGCDAFNYFNPVKQPQGVGYNTNPTTTDVYEKFSWYDLMVSNKFAPVYNTEDHIIVDNYPTYDRRIGIHVGSDMWQSTLHGRGYTNVWVWARTYTDHALKKSILTRPDAIYEVSKASLDANRLSYEIAALADDAAEVGVLWSDTTRIYSDAYLNSWYKTYESAVHNGQKVGFVSENKINEIHNYDVMIFPSVLNIKADRLPEILEYARSGKTLVLLSSENLKRDEHNQPHDEAIISEIYKNATVIENVLDGPKMTKPDDLQKQFADIFDKQGLRRVRVIDTDTGADVKNVEFMYTEYNGKLLLNLVLYDWTKNRNVKVLVDGEPVTSALELRSMTHYGENFELETCRPVLLQIDSDADINKDAVELQIGNPVMRIDGKRKIIDTESYDTVPVVVNDRTLMPVRAIVEAIGGEVSWDDATQTATLKYDGKEMKLTIDSDKAYVDGAEHILDVSPQLINSRTMLPVRFVAESFSLSVDWNNEGEIVTIKK